MKILAGYSRSIFQDFESNLRTKIDLAEDDMRLVSDQYISSFITYDLKSGIHTFSDFSEVLLRILQPEHEVFHNGNVIEFDNTTMKIKLIVRSGVIVIRFDEISFFSTFLGFTPHWDYKHYDEHNSQKIKNLSTINQILV